MNIQIPESKSYTVRMIKREVYQNFSRIHRAMTDVLIDLGRVKIIE